MRRAQFLALAVLGPPMMATARAQDDVDPAMTATSQALRVLLGPGDATADSQSGGFLFNGRPYRGTFQRLSDGRIINVVGLEQYLYSVVPHEMPSRWAAAALQAQAVCARTYVLARSDPRRAFDLVPSELNQLYEGIGGESPAGTQAVDATAGTVLSFARQYAVVAYSSCCGGHTEASSDAWGGPPLPYLGGGVCTWCTRSPNYRWSVGVPADAIAQHFESQLAGRLTGVRVAALDASGRAVAFQLSAPGGSIAVKGNVFRIAVGTRILRSLLITNLQMTPNGDDVEIDGGGLGHGVGLCQWGAQGMAVAGRTAAEILGFYFPGTLLAKLDSVGR